MAIEFGKGIALAGGFDLGAKAPLDSRLTVATIEERDAHVTGNRAYEGMLVYVEADKITYQYIADADGNLTWKEFGFTETDFLVHVADNLTTEDAGKVLSANQGVVLKDMIDAEAEARAEADDTLQANIDTLDAYVGDIPSGYTETNIVAYINKKAEETLSSATGDGGESAASVKAALDTYKSENDARVLAVEGDVADLEAAIADEQERAEGIEAGLESRLVAVENDYLKASDKTELNNLIAAEASRADAAERVNAAAIKTISDDYLKAADKTELEGKIGLKADQTALDAEIERATQAEAGLQTQINTIMNNPDAEGAINSINEFTQYIADHGTIADGFRVDIDKNKDDISAMDAAYKAADTELSGRLDVLEAIDHDAYVAADTALKNELNAEITKKAVAADVAASVQALEAADTAMQGRLDAIEAQLGDGEGSVSDLIVDAKQEAIDAAAADATAKDEALEASLKQYADDEDAKIEATIATLTEAVNSKAAQSEVNTISGKVTTLEADMAQAKTDIDNVEAAVATKAEQADLEAEVSAREALDARVVIVEGKAHTHANATELAKIADGDVAKWNAISDNMTEYVDAEIDKVEAIIGDIPADKTVVQLFADMRAECEANETAAVAAAQNYTDGKIAAVNTAIETAISEEEARVDAELAKKVDKVDGKGLSTNDLTNELKGQYDAAYAHSQVAHAPADAQANIIESVKVNGTALTITGKAVDITVPTDNAELTNGAGYLKAADIANKADKATTLAGYGITDAYTNAQVDSAIATAMNSFVEVSDEEINALFQQ